MTEPDKFALENQWLHKWQPTDELKALAVQVTTILDDPMLTEAEKQAKVNHLITAKEKTKP